MAPGRGLVIEIKGKCCIVLTNDGRFLKVPVPREGTVVGREITVRRPSITSFKQLMAVASLLVAAFAWFVFQMMTPVAAAYVAIDINPSIELGVDKKDVVISARGLNKDGELLLKKINLNKKPLEEDLERIIAQAIQSRYLSTEKDNLILATVTQTNRLWGGKANINVNEIYDTMRQPLNECGLEAELIVSEAAPKVLKEAQKIGITPGRYLIQQGAGKKGIKINNQELRERKISELETSKNIKAAECIKNANPGAITGKTNWTNAKLPGVKKNFQLQVNKNPGGLQKNGVDKPNKAGRMINQTTALPEENDVQVKKAPDTKQQVRQVVPKPDKNGSLIDNIDNNRGRFEEIGPGRAEMKNLNQGKSQDQPCGNYRRGNKGKSSDNDTKKNNEINASSTRED
ncbi:anti-sigma factor domain-containing protein [Desulfotruncus alcoholivorax]|uniref:anti-sigma factor domain-containing protein n=1 Tax=Desulfotruncus alcoholivorax TaxID=265477 RepID=UPI0004041B80|nr:anti-sigma factor domain-containing protein [Desulfotruncus alcoholivorax]